MKTFCVALVVMCMFAVSHARAQSVFEVLQNGAKSGEFEQLRAANEMAEGHANAMAKRASLLSKNVSILREQNDQLRATMEKLQAAQDTSIQHHQLVLQAIQDCLTTAAAKEGDTAALHESLKRVQALMAARLQAEYAAIGIRFASRPEEPGLPPKPQ